MYNPKQTGFFPLVQAKVEEGLSNEDKQVYLGLETLEEKIKWIHALPRISSDHQDNILKTIVKPDFGLKSKEKSVSNRETGNTQFYVGNFKQASILYSVAVFTAPEPTKDCNDLALAYANRSACYQKTGCFKLALRDIELSLTSGYPEDKAFKLEERKGECEAAGGEKTKALDSFQLAIKMIKKNAGVKQNQRDKFIATIQKKIEKVKEEIDHESNLEQQPVDLKNHEPLLSLDGLRLGTYDDVIVEERNEFFDSAHSAVEIRYEEGRGRFAIASKDIQLGTTLFREKPLTATLNPEKFGTNCQHCFGPIRGVVPCLKCTWVCYCSATCRSKANQSYHQYECGIIKLLLESGLNIYAYMALRLVTTEGLENLLKIKEDLEFRRSEKSGASKYIKDSARNFYSSKDFRNAYNLMAHEEHIPEDMWLLRGLVAVFLLKCLKQTDFFDRLKISKEEEELLENSSNGNHSGLTSNEVFIGKVLFRLINVMPCNTHDISEFETPVMDKFVPGCKKVSLGAGLYPCLALLNHSCDPSFMRCNKGNEVICVASKHIKKGQEICENYGLMYTIKDLKERQKILRDHYKFDCACPPCSENWPLLASMKEEVLEDTKRMSRFLAIKCVSCGQTVKRKPTNQEPFSPVQTCLVCGKSTNLLQDIPLEAIKKISSEACETLVRGQWSKGLELAQKTEEMVKKHFSLPVLEVTQVQISIWKCLWLVHGSMRLVKTMS